MFLVGEKKEVHGKTKMPPQKSTDKNKNTHSPLRGSSGLLRGSSLARERGERPRGDGRVAAYRDAEHDCVLRKKKKEEKENEKVVSFFV